MADITRLGPVRHLRGTPTQYVRHLRHGDVRHEGPGQAFWFRSLSAAISEVPVDDREQPLLFHARTRDFQDVTVQATITYRIVRPDLAAGRIDFGIDPDHGGWRSTPLEQVGGLLTELAQQHALTLLAGLPLTQALAQGMSQIKQEIAAGLRADGRLTEIGLEVIDVRVVACRAEAEVERALQTPTREQVQQEADKATYERRAVAVERERAIAENELQNQIELAKREESLVLQRGQNERSKAQERSAAGRIDDQARAESERTLAQAHADAVRVTGTAEAEAERARLLAAGEVDHSTLLALALRELAGSLPEIGSITLTPDLVTQALAGLADATGARRDEPRSAEPRSAGR